VLVTVGLTLAHATNNMLNDYVDWAKGVDQKDYFRIKYGSHPMLTMEKPEFFTYILVTGNYNA
jgi:1,4-dihydroxy-2-naphthoate octaprenyltransferase